jgi:DNA-directed RNA polymerase specialized sigma24 family protein
MSRRDGDAGNLRATLPESLEQNGATAWQRVLDKHAGELLWIAEVMTGGRQTGEQSLAKAIELAQGAQYIGTEWMFSWVKRLIVHVALKKISGQIRDLFPPAAPQWQMKRTKVGAAALDPRRLRSISAPEMIASFDVFERACFILHAYLQYPMLDCALLLGCPRNWVEPICERVLARAGAIGQPADHACRDVDSFISPEVEECVV